jgi:hypothetical protein
MHHIPDSKNVDRMEHVRRTETECNMHVYARCILDCSFQISLNWTCLFNVHSSVFSFL